MLEKRNQGDTSAISLSAHNKDSIPVYSKEISVNEMLIAEGILAAVVAVMLLTKKSTK